MKEKWDQALGQGCVCSLSKGRIGQQEAPLHQAVKELQKGGFLPFHVPLHGRGPGAPHLLRAGLGPLLQRDFTEISPLDDLHRPTGVIHQAQRLAAEFFGAARTYFLVNGATVGLLALCLALTRPGDKVLLTRLSHKAVLHGIALSGAYPVYLPVEREPGTGLPLNVSPETVERALREHPDARLLLVTSPSYWGVTADLHTIGKLAAERKLLFAVDEAHGAHLSLCHEVRPHAAAAGADMWIHSAHKSLGALTPGAYLHLKKPAQGPGISFWLQALQTSSPPYPVLVSLDLARRQAALRGRRIFQKAERWALRFRRALGQGGVPVLPLERSRERSFVIDPCRVTIFCRDGKGPLLSEHLSRQYHLKVEMEAENFILLVAGPAVVSVAPEKLARTLVQALAELDLLDFQEKRDPEKPFALFPFLHGPGGLARGREHGEDGGNPFMLPPRKALMASCRNVPLEAAAGRVSGEMIMLSPPGIPVLSPGERISSCTVHYLLDERKRGPVFQGAADPRLRKIKIVTGLKSI